MGFKIDNSVLISYKEEKGITEVVIPEGLTSIGDNAFQDCRNLTSIIIPEGVTNIGARAFYCCFHLKSIVIPVSVRSIGVEAFNACFKLTSVVLPEGVTIIEDGLFHNCEELTDIVIPKGVTSIGKDAFNQCESLTCMIVPEGVTIIGDNAFQKCEKLVEIAIPKTVTHIGDGAFSSCEQLSNIVIPPSVTSIGEKLFLFCKSLTNLNIPDGVTSIGPGAFAYCHSLQKIVIPTSVNILSHGAFEDCDKLATFTIPEGVSIIERYVFNQCSNLTRIDIPASVTSVEERAFRMCWSLTSLSLPEGVTSIGKEAFDGCTKLKEIHGLLSLIYGGCNIHATTLTWLLYKLWNGPESLKETVQVYLISSAKTVDEFCEKRLFENCSASANVMLDLIEVNKANSSALKKTALFALACGERLASEKLDSIRDALQRVGAKAAMKLFDQASKSEEPQTIAGGTGHPVEAVCLKRYKEALVDKGLKAYKVPLNFFEGVHYKGSKTLAPAFVLKCVVLPYMQQLKELPKNIGDYQTDFIHVVLDSQIDEVADALDREELQKLLERLISKCDTLEQPRLLLPYCRFGSGKQINDLAAFGKKWTYWEEYLARGRRNNIVIHGAMLLNDSREAMFLVEKWGFLDEYAKLRNTTADVLRDTVLTEFDLDADGSKRYDLGNAVIAASVGQDLSVTLFNETNKKEVKSLPKKGADPEKYAAASEDFADLKKNIKNAVKSRVEKLKEDFVSGREINAPDWKASYLNNYVLKQVASLLVWQWKHDGSTMRFMLTMNSTFIGCNGQPVEVSDTGLIAVAHPVEIPAEELECWKTLLTDQQIAQPFVQVFEPVCELDPSVVVSQYEGIELPMFLLRGLAKEGVKDIDFMYEGSWLHIQGKAITINASVISGGYFYTERAIPFDAVVSLNEVKFVGTSRAVNHEIYAMDKALIENRVRNGDIAAVQAFSSGITAKTVQHLIDVSIQAEKMEVTAWLMNYKNDHFPYTFADLEL